MSSQHLVSLVILEVRYEWGKNPDKTFRKSLKLSLSSCALAPVNPYLSKLGSQVRSERKNGRKVSSRLKNVLNWLFQCSKLSRVSFFVKGLGGGNFTKDITGAFVRDGLGLGSH